MYLRMYLVPEYQYQVQGSTPYKIQGRNPTVLPVPGSGVKPLRNGLKSVQPTYAGGKPLSSFRTTGYFGPISLNFAIGKIVPKQLKITVHAAAVAVAKCSECRMSAGWHSSIISR